jgi:hypothetical protein
MRKARSREAPFTVVDYYEPTIPIQFEPMMLPATPKSLEIDDAQYREVDYDYYPLPARARSGSKGLPGLVTFLLLLLELTLVARIVCLALNIPVNAPWPWVAPLYQISTILIRPIGWLTKFMVLPSQLMGTTLFFYLECVAAMIGYAILVRIIWPILWSLGQLF